MASEQGYIMAYEETQEDAVIKVEVIKSTNQKLVVKHLVSGEVEEIEKDEFFPLDLEAEKGCEDLAELKSFNEAALLINLQSRYAKQKIYTKMNSTLVVVNPYMHNSKRISKKKIKKYWKKSNSALNPHIFSVGKAAHLNLLNTDKNQVILISGESGAGKTESTKHVLQFLSSHNSSEFSEVEQKIVNCGPILEAFGNAKTIRNNNSSRFGKFVKLYYDDRKENIKSASIESFLLEKSRVVRHAAGEKNFHVFYLMCRHLDREALQDLGLTSSDLVDFSGFRYMCPYNEEVKSEENESFGELMEAFRVNSFTNYEITAIWKVLSGILHIGNVQFNDSEYNENNPCTVEGKAAETASKVLEISIYNLITSLTTIKRVFDKTEISSPVPKVVCESLRDTLAKYLYDNLFNWIIKKLNQGLRGREGKFIGILDIYGFEVFPKNSFEQLCINFANEKLQQLSIQYTFKADEEEMKQENLAKYIPSIPYSDNKTVLDLLEGNPSGIFRLVDEACSVKTSEEVLLSTIKKKHQNSEVFLAPKTNSPNFVVVHTAAQVTYEIEGFISKNIDEVRPEFEGLMQNSASKLVKLVSRGENGKGKFIGDKFRKEINLLMMEIGKCSCWFVKCIKPNEEKAPWVFNQRTVLNQIQYLGLLDSIMVRKKGFPIRVSHQGFFEAYKALKGFVISDKNVDFKAFCEELAAGVNNPGFLVGKTKIFMKQEIEDVLKQVKTEKIVLQEKAAVSIQGWYKARKVFRNFKEILKSAKKIQDSWRRWKNRQGFINMKKKAVLIQRWFRSMLYREQIAMREFGLQIFYQYLKIKIEDIFLGKCFNLALSSQKIYRGHRTRRLLKGKKLISKVFNHKIYKPTFELLMREMKEASALKIQKQFRGHLVRTRQVKSITQLLTKNKQRRMAIRIQKWFRGQVVRNKLRKVIKASTKIQSSYRAHSARQLYFKTLKSVSLIQSFTRARLIRSKAIKSRLSNFISKENALIHNLCLFENSEIFSTIKPEENFFSQSFLRTLSNTENFSNKEGSLALQSKQVSPFHIEKIYFFARPIDLEVLSDQSVVYEPLWSQQLEALNKELLVKEEHIMDLALGTCHSLAITSKGRVFAWGWNDKHQCGSAGNRPRVLDLSKDVKFVQISAGDDHSLALTTSGQVFAFGDNSKGQLGQGNYSEYKVGVFLDIPICKQVVAVSNQNMAISVNGELFLWPFETILGEKRSYPMKMLYDYSVQEVSVGYNFAMILATSGILFSLGSNNQSGQLGHGDKLSRSSPTMVLALKKLGEKIFTVSCGQKHVIAKSTLGKIFTWGGGTEGQLGHGSFSNELLPRLVPLKSGLKPIQISAGLQHSLLLQENRKILLSGRNSSGQCCSFTEFNIGSKLPELFIKPGEFSLVKIGSVWSRGFAVMMATVADLRFVQGNSKVMNSLGLLAGKWTGKGIEPPNLESIAGYFPVGLSKKGGKVVQKSGRTKPLDELKDKISEILKKPGDKWTAEERSTMEHITKITY